MAMAAAVAAVLAAIMAAAAAQAAEVRWEVAYLTVEPLGRPQKVRTCRYHLCLDPSLSLSLLRVLWLSESFRFRPPGKKFLVWKFLRGFSLSLSLSNFTSLMVMGL